MEKVVGTEKAIEVLDGLKNKYQDLILIHSEGCCDGTSPICVEARDFYLGSQYEQVGMITGIPYYMHKANQDYWKHLKIVIDVSDGMGNSFSLESIENKSFIIKAEIL